jgi:ATP-dependent DNA helicase PIF1
MKESIEGNNFLKLSKNFIENTARNVFLTGKAGTGKTTFLKFIQKETSKNLVTVAPTGVAAANANGMTLNSFFQLAPGYYLEEPFLPSQTDGFYHIPEVLRKLNYSSEKINLLKALELLIIDEISMVRADQLDIIDRVLRHIRKNDDAFGGVQILLIGDLFQLPPVIKKEDWEILSRAYRLPYFFDSFVSHKFPFLQIELDVVYRQADLHFIKILNQIRHNNVSEESFAALNARYNIEKNHFDGITITSHNSKANEINAMMLNSLEGKEYILEHSLSGKVKESSFAAEATLRLKIGAKVMLIRNDTGEDRRFYNGRIGTVNEIVDNGVCIFFEDKSEVVIEKAIWISYEYQYNTQLNKMEQVEVGRLTQYPIKLAWAVTIHKSQGLSFDNAIIDAGNSFASGQVYVALSRVRSLEGISLSSLISPESLGVDPGILDYLKPMSIDELQESLNHESDKYFMKIIYRFFDFQDLSEFLSGKPDFIRKDQLITWLSELSVVFIKFKMHMDKLFVALKSVDYFAIKERITSACVYFITSLEKNLLADLIKAEDEVTKGRGSKLLVSEIRELIFAVNERIRKIHELQKLELTHKYLFIEAARAEFAKQFLPPALEQLKPGKTPPTNKSKFVSYELFVSGLSISEIAKKRNMSLATIESHICEFIATGEINAEKVLDHYKLAVIIAEIHNGSTDIIAIRENLGNSFSFFEIRVALSHFSVRSKR